MPEYAGERIGRSYEHPSDREWMTNNEAGKAFGVTPSTVTAWERKHADFPQRHTEGVPTRKLMGETKPTIAWKANELVEWHERTNPGRPKGAVPWQTDWSQASENRIPPFRNLGAQFTENFDPERTMPVTWDQPSEENHG